MDTNTQDRGGMAGSKGTRHVGSVRAATLALALLACVWAPSRPTMVAPAADPNVTVISKNGVSRWKAASADDPVPVLGREGLSHLREAMLAALAASQTKPEEAKVADAKPTGGDPSALFAEREDVASPSKAETPRLAQAFPLPVPRPPEFRVPVPSGPAPMRMARRGTRQAQAVPAAPAEDTRSFVEKLFGIEIDPATPKPALAYAALETGPVEKAYRKQLNPVPPPMAGLSTPAQAGAGVAVYDISARIVHMPNGEKLEAHSGLGAHMDDPRGVHVKMRGATPPATYDLTEREALFHGVRAIRLNPVGGSETIHGRVGLLAHTYMLGPQGASNGCVSFKDYDKFLQAYLRGEVQRLVVVAGKA